MLRVSRRLFLFRQAGLVYPRAVENPTMNETEGLSHVVWPTLVAREWRGIMRERRLRPRIAGSHRRVKAVSNAPMDRSMGRVIGAGAWRAGPQDGPGRADS